MPDKKPIDSEIVKAWECCKSDTALCNECPYDKIGECIEKMCTDSIDLINRLQAENERLQNILICFMDALGKVRKVDDIDEISLIPLMSELNKQYRAELKAEAYKEFVEKLDKASFTTGYTTVFGGKDVPIKHITMANVHSVLKDLVGDSRA